MAFAAASTIGILNWEKKATKTTGEESVEQMNIASLTGSEHAYAHFNPLGLVAIAFYRY